MAVYTETKTYHTKAHMGMIDVTEDFHHAVEEAARQKNIRNGTITGFTTGGVAALTTLEFEPGLVGHDLKAALDVFSPYRDEKGRVIHYQHHDTWHDDNGSSHIKALLLSPFITVPIVAGRMTLGPWQNLTLVAWRHPGSGAGHRVSGHGRVSKKRNGSECISKKVSACRGFLFWEKQV